MRGLPALVPGNEGRAVIAALWAFDAVLAVIVIALAAVLVRRFFRNAGQRADRLADPAPLPEEQGRRTDPDPEHRYFRPPPPVWPPQMDDRPPE